MFGLFLSHGALSPFESTYLTLERMTNTKASLMTDAKTRTNPAESTVPLCSIREIYPPPSKSTSGKCPEGTVTGVLRDSFTVTKHCTNYTSTVKGLVK